MNTYYEDLRKAKHLQAEIVHHPKGGTGQGAFRVMGLIEGDISLSATADFSSPFEEIASGLGQVQEGLAQVTGIEALAARRLKSISQTVSIWQNSSRPQFSFNITLFNYEEGMDVMKDAIRLLSMTQPQTQTVGDVVGTVIQPSGYNSVSGSGTWSLRYGEWFKAYDLTLNEVSIIGSAQQTGDDGTPRPHMVTISCTLVPRLMTTETGVQSYYTL